MGVQSGILVVVNCGLWMSEEGREGRGARIYDMFLMQMLMDKRMM